MTYINITRFVLINELQKDHSMIKTHPSKCFVIFIKTILSFVRSRKIGNYVFQREKPNLKGIDFAF